MSVNFSPFGNTQIVDENGAPAVGWKINTYTAGSSSPLAAYTSSDGLTAQSNPIILNALGYPTLGQFWLTEGLTYKFQVTDENDVIKYTVDNVSGINDNASSTSQWITSGVIPTYVSANSFSLIGDQMSAFQVYRRARFSTTAGTVYGNITASVFNGTITTVTMQMDSPSVLDTGLSAVDLSFMEANPLALPSGFNQSFAMVGASIIGAKGATVASAATTPIFGATDGNTVDISGNFNGITSLGTGLNPGYTVSGTFTGTPTLTPSANLVLNGGVGSIVIRAGDTFVAKADTAAQATMVITRADGSPVTAPPLRNFISGFSISPAGATASIPITAGQCSDSANAVLISLNSTITKTTSAWAVGTAAGGLDTGAIANSTTYHLYAIRRPDTGVVDVVFSLSPSSPTLPANYTQYRRIGSRRTDSVGQWHKVNQFGDLCELAGPILDISAVNPGTAATTRTLTSVPTGIVVMAKVIAGAKQLDAGGSAATYFSPLDTNDVAPSVSAAPLFSSGAGELIVSSGGVQAAAVLQFIKTNTSAQIRSRTLFSNGNTTVLIATLGWVDTRDRDS